MPQTKIIHIAALAGALLTSTRSMQAAEALLPAQGWPTIRDTVPAPAPDAWNRRWIVSATVLAASQSLDAASSYGMRELNPVLAGPDGTFGPRAAAIKFGVAGGLLGIEYLMVRKFPRSAKFFTIVNWTATGATTGLAVHNYRLPGR